MTTKKIIALVGLIILVATSAFFLINKNEEISDFRYRQHEKRETESKLVNNVEYIVDESDLYKANDLPAMADETTLSENEEKWLILMREEEKLARDVYLKLADIWGMQIFSNIANSEQTHTEAIKTLIYRYDLTDPVTDDTIGVFTNPEFTKLYNDLVAQGSESLLSALKIGATIEDLDINDLDKALTETSKEDIKIVYQNLQKGSRNHLRAFVRQIERSGENYYPQYISLESFEEIISSPQEKGRIE